MSAEEKQRGIVAAQKARTELYDTLSQLKDRLNYARRVDDAVAAAKSRIAQQKRSNPAAFAAGVVGVAAAAGLAVWGVASTVAKRFQ
ncbi:MAG: DUF3618 domain-containing protein [Leucobacter sp.]